MEEWIEKMIREGDKNVLRMLASCMSEEMKTKYKELFKRIKEEKK